MADDENTLTEIFMRDPLELTNPDIEKVITFYREQRQRFVTTGKVKEPKAPKKGQEVLNISLGDLGL